MNSLLSDAFPFHETKVWGSVCHLLLAPNVSISHLQLEQGGYCSVHYHKQRDNHFILLDGNVQVSLYGKEETPTFKPLSVVSLYPRRQFIVPAMIWHQFEVLEAGSMVELYTPSKPGDEVLFEDIIRHSQGGKRHD